MSPVIVCNLSLCQWVWIRLSNSFTITIQTTNKTYLLSSSFFSKPQPKIWNHQFIYSTKCIAGCCSRISVNQLYLLASRAVLKNLETLCKTFILRLIYSKYSYFLLLNLTYLFFIIFFIYKKRGSCVSITSHILKDSPAWVKYCTTNENWVLS